MSPFQVTYEVPDERAIRFLDIRLKLCGNGAYWQYQPRAAKPLLPFNSAHSKPAKSGIIMPCFQYAPRSSFSHLVAASVEEQVSRRMGAGFPSGLLSTVAETVLRKTRVRNFSDEVRAPERPRFTVISYVHNLSHRLNKIGCRMKVSVGFTAP